MIGGKVNYRLGLDLGARSIGWAAIEVEGEEERRLIGLGVRVFEAGVEGSIELGKDESRGVKRRIARNSRRQTRRRRQRARLLYRTLMQAGLLPQLDLANTQPTAVQIQEALNRLDSDIREKYSHQNNVHWLPYLLRARALDEPLTELELGRALYHLGQRRGFRSNRKADAKKDEEKGKVYGGIHDLEAKLKDCRTLGEYYSRVNPEADRIRGRYTHRSMYESEFDLIWQAQASHHPAMTEELREKLSHILFDQRPLQSKEDEIGNCEWDPDEKRAPAWSLEFQRFRLLQSVVHLRVQPPHEGSRPLDDDQRRLLIERLDTARELGFRDAKTLLSIPSTWKFSIEDGGEKKLRGNAVGAQMAKALGERWTSLDDERKSALLTAIATSGTDEELQSRLTRDWGYDDALARTVAENVTLPQGYASLSLKSMRTVIPYLQAGISVQEARQMAGYDLGRPVPVHELLPPLKDSGLDVRNPAVARTLTEVRKVVNAAVRKWGKPVAVHIETVRELKKSRDDRQKDTKRMRDREALRDRMRKQVAEAKGCAEELVRRSDIEIGLLYEECGGHCPYTGESLGSFSSLFGGNSKAQVEHIIPRSISLDDSFANLTLALASENARKGNRTPHEAYGHDEQRWSEVVQRVSSFKGDYARRKLERVKTEGADKEELLSKFASRHLNDTRYSTVLAGRYLALLYGGEVVDGTRRILKSTGQITADLRNAWDLNRILSDGPRKSRDDHRHHAVDAAVLAVVRQKWVQVLSNAAERAQSERKRRYASIEPPWTGFKEDLDAAIKTANISFRPDHRVTGALHKETHYSPVGKTKTGGDVVRTRKLVHKLSAGEVDSIADEGVRNAVKARLADPAVNNDPKKLENNWPELPNANGAPVKIKKVRIEMNRAVQAVGAGHRQRWAEGGETHHVEVFEVTKGKKRVWDGVVVSMREALERVGAGKPVVDRSEHDGRGFLFSLCKGDTVKLSGDRSGIWVVRKIQQNKQVLLVPQTDARIEGEREQFAPTVSGLQKLSAQRVQVSPLGEVLRSRE